MKHIRKARVAGESEGKVETGAVREEASQTVKSLVGPLKRSDFMLMG